MSETRGQNLEWSPLKVCIIFPVNAKRNDCAFSARQAALQE